MAAPAAASAHPHSRTGGTAAGHTRRAGGHRARSCAGRTPGHEARSGRCGTAAPRSHALRSHGNRTHVAVPRPVRPLAPTAVISPAAVIAGVLATPCQNTELTPEASNIALVQGAVLCLINRERALHGLAPLTGNPDLQRAAEEHTSELVEDDYFAHVAPNGTTPVGRIEATGYIPSPGDGYVIGENLAWGTLSLSTPASIVAAWIASPGHLANILEAQYQDTGIGVVPAVPPSLGAGQPGATYSQEFGVILR